MLDQTKFGFNISLEITLNNPVQIIKTNTLQIPNDRTAWPLFCLHETFYSED